MLPSRYKVEGGAKAPGGFGSVLPVHDTYLGRPVLFKSMHDPKNNGQLLNEIHGLSRARSRHVVEIYDVIVGASGDVEGIIIEKLTGREYGDFHKQALQDPLGYLKVIYQIATALRDLHAAGIVHRDLKLENMRESDAGILKLFDFGISSSDAGYHTKENKGTLVYAAPELYQAGVMIARPMDIYAFGVCCWALATDKLPGELFETPPQKSGRAPSLANVFKASLDVDVVRMLDDCLHPNPDKRPSAEQVSQLLERHLLKGEHKGLFVQGGAKLFELSAASPLVRLQIAPLGEVRVVYNGIEFSVSAVTGSVFINNVPAKVGDVLHGACVLTFGDFLLGADRQWVTFLSSHPELVL